MDVVYYYLLVLIGVRVHLFPSRTQKLSLLSPTIVAGRLAAKIGNANTITGLPKGGPVFYTCKRWRRLGVDGRWAFGGSCSAGDASKSAAPQAERLRARTGRERRAVVVSFAMRLSASCFSALAENAINFILCQRCAAAGGIGDGKGGKISDCVPHVYAAASRLCACVKNSFLPHARIDLRSRRRRRYTYRNRARAW